MGSLTAVEVMELARESQFINTAAFYKSVSPNIKRILDVMKTPEFLVEAQSNDSWDYMYALRKPQVTDPSKEPIHFILGSNHCISHDVMRATEDDILDMCIECTRGWTEIDQDKALPNTFDLRIMNKLKGIKEITSMESIFVHDRISYLLSQMMTNIVQANPFVLRQVVRGLNEVLADLFLCGNAELNWFIYRLTWMLLLGKQGSIRHEEALLQQRNKEWIEMVMPELLAATERDESQLIICGCNHLFGHRGMLELCKDYGYEYVLCPVNRNVPTLPIRFPKLSRVLRTVVKEQWESACTIVPNQYSSSKACTAATQTSCIILLTLGICSLAMNYL